MKRVLILGCGPAGLVAAQAARLHGARVYIASRKQKSFIGGAQYLHEPIPEISDSVQPDGYIRIMMVGSEEGYAQKVYGIADAETSWRNYEDGARVPAWDLRRAYDDLYELFEDHIVNTELDADVIGNVINTLEPDLVVSAIPLPALCIDHNHLFTKQNVYVDMDRGLADNVIVWNGDPRTEWYRASRIFSVTGGYEYPDDGTPVRNARLIGKPLDNDCDCWPDIVRTGRYGKWKKDVLVHHSFAQITEALQ